MADSALETRFQDAASKIRDWKPSQSPSNDEKLAVYSLYKQATVGDVQGDRPGMFSMEARAKYDAWAKRKGMAKEEAMQAYIDEVESQMSKYQ